MTLGEAKAKVWRLLDEHSSGGEVEHDADIELKMNAFFDIAQKQIAGLKKIYRLRNIRLSTGKTEYTAPEDMISPLRLTVDGRVRAVTWRAGKLYIPWTASAAVLEYFAMPEDITDDTPDSYEFEVAPDAQEAMPFFVAAQQLVSDLVMDYAAMLQMYNLMIAHLDTTIPQAAPRLRQRLFRRP